MNHYNCIYMYISPSNKIYIGKAKDFLKRRKTHLDSSYNEKHNFYKDFIKCIFKDKVFLLSSLCLISLFIFLILLLNIISPIYL